MDKYWWWPIIPVVSAAAVAFAVFIAGRRAAADKEALDVHREVTAGPGGEARGALSKAEYAWWSAGETLLTKGGSEGSYSREELNRAFYRVDASLSRLVVALSPYPKWWGFWRAKRYRRLLGWHAGIHMAWMVWYIGCLSVDCYEADDDKNKKDVALRLRGAEGRLWVAVQTIGGYRVHRDGPPDSATNKVKTIRAFATEEIETWLKPILGKRAQFRGEQLVREAKWVEFVASKILDKPQLR